MQAAAAINPGNSGGALFFFASRRRHTRLQGDWSSDVCSSDLAISDEELMSYRQLGSPFQGHPTPVLPWVDVATGSLGQGFRSEERRVGKECRDRCATRE